MNRPSSRPAPLDEVTRRHRARNSAHATHLGEQESVPVEELAGVIRADNVRRARSDDATQAREELSRALAIVLDACEAGDSLSMINPSLDLLVEAVRAYHRSAGTGGRSALDAMYAAVARMERASERTRAAKEKVP